MNNKKDNYQRILRTDDAEADDDDDDDEQDGNPSTARRKVKRRGSHSSSSYHSLMPDDDDDDEDEDKDEQGYSSVGERSPLRGTFDNQDDILMDDFGTPNSGSGSGRQMTTETISVVTTPNKPIVYPSLSNLYSSSFSLEDDEDDDEADLKRYALDFSIHTTDNNHNNKATLMHSSLHGGASSSAQAPSSSSSSLQQQQQPQHPRTRFLYSLVQYLWFSFQSVRQQARQRRAQLLLQQSDERNWSTTLWICLMTYCDATDRGIATNESTTTATTIHTPIATALGKSSQPPAHEYFD
jgi:hypothetical protein